MKKIFFFTFILIFFGFCAAGAGISYIALQVFSGDYSKFSKEKILDILSKETILFYNDGTSQLGSLFGQEHRIYVGIENIPQVMKDAIISAEDKDFYTNIGINIKGIARASIHNILFHTRQGASTITQQTVKNLYGRKETDLATKFYEMINAFKLERKYSKDQILEFYLNQFHVVGNGRGVGVASKYYFNKDVQDLNLVESAFIAGSVKGPEKYNPFTKTSIKSQDRAKHEALIRKNYVLDKMLANHKITQQQHDDAVNIPVPFSQGRFQYNEIMVNQIVQKQLGKPEILQAINASNLDEIGTMGLHITTTLDKEIQNAAQYGLRQNLSSMQMVLKGFALEPESNYTNIQKPELYSFYVARIDSIDRTPDKETMVLNFGVPKCIVQTESINRVAIETDQTFKFGLKRSKQNFLNMLIPGRTILASIKKIDTDGTYYCDLETHPKVQGASLVLNKGQVTAMAGGFSSNEYNRAIFAQRQPGSTFKIPTYYAALQMGWSVIDPIPNVRDVFLWQGNFYFPRPDHLPKTLETTILGAGAKSENLASIWILAHMLDKLSYNQFLDLLKFLGISKEGNSTSQILANISNKFNATADNTLNISEGILSKIKNDEMSDLNVLTNNSLKLFIRTLHMGTGFDKQEEVILADKELADKEKNIRINQLKNNLLRWNNLEGEAKKALSNLTQIIQQGKIITETDRELLSHFSIIDGTTDSFVFKSDTPWQPSIASPLIPAITLKYIPIEELITKVKANPDLLSPNHVMLDGVVPITMLDTINEDLAKKLKEIESKDPLERLFWNEDFRYSLGMYYTANMVNAMGVNESLKWVPSFPLGSNVVTLSDLALMYQTFLTGNLYRYFNTSNQPNQLILIKRIEDSDGNLLWEAKTKEYQFQDSFYSIPILNTLRGTVTAGTAYTLNNSIMLRSNDPVIDQKLLASKIRVPAFGKTGTTNNFTNGTYIGFLPYPNYKGDTLSASNAYTIATYIGFDSNEPMVRKQYHAYGGVAIPAWQEIALSIIKNQNFADKLNWEDYANDGSHAIPFNFGHSLTQVILPIHSGVSIAASAPEKDPDDPNTDIYANDYSETGKRTFAVYLDGSISDDIFTPKRKVSFYAPYMINTDTTAPLEKKFKEPSNPEK